MPLAYSFKPGVVFTREWVCFGVTLQVFWITVAAAPGHAKLPGSQMCPKSETTDYQSQLRPPLLRRTWYMSIRNWGSAFEKKYRIRYWKYSSNCGRRDNKWQHFKIRQQTTPIRENEWGRLGNAERNKKRWLQHSTAAVLINVQLPAAWRSFWVGFAFQYAGK